MADAVDRATHTLSGSGTGVFGWSASPDGYTLLSVSASHAVAPAIYSKMPYVGMDHQRRCNEL